MSFRDMMASAFGNLTRHKVRTALTTVGVVVGILTIVTMVSLGIGVQREMGDAFNSVGLETVRLYPVEAEADAFNLLGQPERTQIVTPELVAQLQARDDVVEVTPFLRLPGGIRMTLRLDGREVQATPYGPMPADVLEPFETPPRVLAGAGEPPAEGGGVVVTSALLEDLGISEEQYAALIGREVELVLHAPRGESQVYSLEIAGVEEQRWRASVALASRDRLAMLRWWYNDAEYMAHRGYDEVVIRAASLNDAVQIVDWLSSLGFQVQSLKTMLDMANRGMIILQTMLGSVGTLALLVASIGIANTMIMSVYERTKEIGILKAVGAAPGQIRSLFVIEASLIGLLGGIVGTIAGWLLGKGLNWLALKVLAWQDIPMQGTFFVVSWWLVLAALAFGTLVGLLAGLYPAARAARLAPLDALRYE
jgi:ABC-type lipoprotein release transport system permease subunit